MNSYEVTTRSAGRTREIGRILGQLARAGDVFLMSGELGAGKTCLTQGIAAGLGVDEYVTSPTFVLLREYRGRLPLYHIDFYRLQALDEIGELGLDEYLYGNGISVVEWAEKGSAWLPSEHLVIEMEHVTSTRRKLSFAPTGRRYEDMLSALESALGSSRVAGK